MRYTTFIPDDGIRGRLFAELISIESMDAINDLIELGFIQNPEMDKIALYPLVQEIIISDLNPDSENCRPLLDNIHRICLQHGVDIPYYSALFAITENVPSYLALSENAATAE
ncbi:hypothetical protein [Ruminococcus albus]|nr:hypothetical protein [Ruminococcus albus]